MKSYIVFVLHFFDQAEPLFMTQITLCMWPKLEKNKYIYKNIFRYMLFFIAYYFAEHDKKMLLYYK